MSLCQRNDARLPELLPVWFLDRFWFLSVSVAGIITVVAFEPWLSGGLAKEQSVFGTLRVSIAGSTVRGALLYCRYLV